MGQGKMTSLSALKNHETFVLLRCLLPYMWGLDSLSWKKVLTGAQLLFMRSPNYNTQWGWVHSIKNNSLQVRKVESFPVLLSCKFSITYMILLILTMTKSFFVQQGIVQTISVERWKLFKHQCVTDFRGSAMKNKTNKQDESVADVHKTCNLPMAGTDMLETLEMFK